MKTNPTKILLLSLLTLFLFGCLSPSKLYHKGKFDAAFEKSKKKLIKDKKVMENQLTLIQSYNEILKNGFVKLESFSDNTDLSQQERAFRQYQSLIKKYESAERYLEGDYEGQYEAMQADAEKIRQNLVNGYWTLANESMSLFDETRLKKYAQDAYHEFGKVQKYEPQFEHIDSLLTDSYDKGTVIVVFNASANFDFIYNHPIYLRFSCLNRKYGNFVDYYYSNSPKEADCMIDIRFDKLYISDAQSCSSESFSKTIEDGYTTETDTAGVVTKIPKYKDIQGTVTTTTKTKTAQWTAHVYVSSASPNCNFSGTSFFASHSSTCKSYTTSGDRRAIPSVSSDESCEGDRNMAINLISQIYSRVNTYY